MAEARVDAMVLRLSENVLLATGYWVQMGGLGLVLVPREGNASLLVPEYEELEARGRFSGDVQTFPAIRLDGEPAPVAIERLLREFAGKHDLLGCRVGYEGSFDAMAPPRLDGEPNAIAHGAKTLVRSAFNPERLVDVSSALESIRCVKSNEEVERLKITNEIARFGLEAFKEHAVAGRTEAEIAAEVQRAIIARGHGYRGARTVRAYPTVLSGPDTMDGWQYFLHRDRVVEPNDLVMLELGTCADGYWSDHTRTVAAGKATERQREAYAAVLAGVEAALAAAKPGATGREVDEVSRATVRQAGFRQFPHHTGHGVGFRYHESRPQLTPTSDHLLEAGTVLVVEPGIYEEDLGGFRYEDDAVVTESGATRLASTDYGLD
jgi:Xaa-Pro aminopeptidase